MQSTRSIPATAAPLAGPPPVDLEAVKARQRAVWSSGDFAVIGSTLQIVGETLCEAAEVAAGERVLDVACGNGNAALAAARRFARVTGVDFVPALLEKARGRAAASGLALELREADAEALPFPDGAFDAVVSTFGVQFTPDPARAARELLRVCRPGGRVALAAWTPDGFIGQVFRAVGAHAPPPPGVPSPARWGTEAHLHELLGGGGAAVRTAVRTFTFRYHSAAHWLEVFRTWYGPILRAFQGLPPAGQAALERDLLALLEAGNTARDGSLAVPATYLEAVIVRG